jgi:uncharacterized iron-regulated protein
MQTILNQFLVLIALSVVFPANTQSHHKLFDSKGVEISFSDLIVRMEQADILLFGEQHDDSIAHALQLNVWKLFHERFGNSAVLSMEMFSSDVQTVMNEYLAGFITEKHFKTDARIWNNYQDYRPLVEYARENKLPVICANAAGRYSNFATRKGLGAFSDLPKSSLSFLPPFPIDTASGAYYQKLMDLMGGHGAGHSSYSLIPGQSLWDATMAYFISKYWNSNKKAKILHLNGRFHSDGYMGVFTQIKKYAPKARVLVLSAQPASELSPAKVDLSLGDFILATLKPIE